MLALERGKNLKDLALQICEFFSTVKRAIENKDSIALIISKIPV